MGLEFFELNFNGPIDSGQFLFTPGNLEIIDRTEEFVRSLGEGDDIAVLITLRVMQLVHPGAMVRDTAASSWYLPANFAWFAMLGINLNFGPYLGR